MKLYEKLILLNNFEDISLVKKSELINDSLLFCTNPGIDIFLKKIQDIDCPCLSKLITEDAIICDKQNASAIVNKELLNLDNIIGTYLNSHNGNNLRYFIPLYSYLGKYHLLTYISLKRAIESIINTHNIKEIASIDLYFNNFLNTNNTISNFCDIFFPEIAFKPIAQKACTIKTIYQNLYKLYRRLKRFVFRFSNRNDIDIRYINNFQTKTYDIKKCIIICNPLYDIEFIINELNDYNIFFCNDFESLAKKTPLEFRGSIKTIELLFDKYIEQKDNQIERLFVKDIKSDFLTNCVRYLRSLDYVKKLNKNLPIAIGIWGTSPASGAKALIFEYLRNNNIPVLGAQHGASYGDSYEEWHFDSDFNRCDFFISYGFTQKKLKRLYPERFCASKILPVGKADIPNYNRKRISIDIFFAPTSTFSMLEGGMSRLPPHELADRQMRIVEYLNTLKNVKSFIKPVIYSNYNNCSIFSLLNRYKNINIVFDVTVKEFLARYCPRIIIIEYPSTPLYELIHLDVDIFLMTDPIMPYEQSALEMLNKRAFILNDVDDLITKLDLFLTGSLEKKRDHSFYHNYIYKKNTPNNIMRVINNLSSKQQKAQANN